MTKNVEDFIAKMKQSNIIKWQKIGIQERNRKIEALEYERANMIKTHQDTISSYQKQIAELEAQLSSNTLQVKTCDGCKWNDLPAVDYKPIYYPCRTCVAHSERYFTYNYELKETT